METPKVSIIIPCYNHGAYLRECIQGFEDFNSQYPYEVIIVNDGSTEAATLEAMREMEGKGYRIIHQENLGLAAARNTGINHARGEIILPLDADNIVLSDYLNLGVRIFDNEPSVGVVYSNAVYFGERSGKWLMPEFNYFRLFRGNFIDACALFRKQVWVELGGYDEHMPYMGWEDWDFWMRTALSGFEFRHINHTGFKYRVRKGSMISETNKHIDELKKYIFSKKELTAIAELRERALACEDFYEKYNSMEYKIADVIFTKLRSLKRCVIRRYGE